MIFLEQLTIAKKSCGIHIHARKLHTAKWFLIANYLKSSWKFQACNEISHVSLEQLFPNRLQWRTHWCLKVVWRCHPKLSVLNYHFQLPQLWQFLYKSVKICIKVHCESSFAFEINEIVFANKQRWTSKNTLSLKCHVTPTGSSLRVKTWVNIAQKNGIDRRMEDEHRQASHLSNRISFW